MATSGDPNTTIDRTRRPPCSHHPLFEKLSPSALERHVKRLKRADGHDRYRPLDFEQRLDLLVDREVCERENRQLKSRLTKAKLRLNACVEDIDFRQRRGLDKALFLQLAQCRWIKEHHNLIITGPTGVGKTYLAWCPCPQCLPPGIYRPVSAPSQAHAGSVHRPGRRSLRQFVKNHGTGRSARARRLGTEGPGLRAAARSSGNYRRTVTGCVPR